MENHIVDVKSWNKNPVLYRIIPPCKAQEQKIAWGELAETGAVDTLPRQRKAEWKGGVQLSGRDKIPLLC